VGREIKLSKRGKRDFPCRPYQKRGRDGFTPNRNSHSKEEPTIKDRQVRNKEEATKRGLEGKSESSLLRLQCTEKAAGSMVHSIATPKGKEGQRPGEECSRGPSFFPPVQRIGAKFICGSKTASRKGRARLRGNKKRVKRRPKQRPRFGLFVDIKKGKALRKTPRPLKPKIRRGGVSVDTFNNRKSRQLGQLPPTRRTKGKGGQTTPTVKEEGDDSCSTYEGKEMEAGIKGREITVSKLGGENETCRARNKSGRFTLSREVLQAMRYRKETRPMDSVRRTEKC